MSDDGGTDNPAFSNDEETSCNNSTSTASAGRGHDELEPTGAASCAGSGGDAETTITENGKSHSSFVSQHYVEPGRKGSEPPTQFTSETKIEMPEDGMSGKTPSATDTPRPKQNGVHGNGNNNDVSFLNSTVTSVVNNGTL